jgi:ABC-type branched-subunit amino acid transport system ATPase component
VTALLDARGVVKSYGGLRAVDDVDLEVGAGEMVGLIGPNGSGKTTLFDCISRVQDLDRGTVLLDGVDITRKRPHKVAHLGLSRTFQVIRIYRELTVAENMELSVQWRDIGVGKLFRRSDSTTTDQADELLDFLLLGDVRRELAATLSGGQRRSLELGMALMSDP